MAKSKAVVRAKSKRSRASGKGRKTAEKPGRERASTGKKVELLDMSEAIDLLKTTRSTFYRWLRSGKIRGMKVGRQWRFERAEIERFLKGEEPRIELRTDITPLIKDLEQKIREAQAKETVLSGETDLPKETAVQRAVELILRIGLLMRASDVHLAAHWNPDQEGRTREQTVAVVRVRVDGVLHVITQFDARLLPAIVEQTKILASCNPDVTDRPLDGRVVLHYAGNAYDLRVHFLPAFHGEALAVRVLEPAKVLPALDVIGFSSRDRERILKAMKAPCGVVLITGPTGSGKTTTLYACLKHINTPELKIMTAEQPVEYVFPWMVQVHVDPRRGMTWSSAIRAILRSDVDVMVIGEIREPEPLQLGMLGAISGHLVLSSMHAHEAAHALRRTVEMGCEPFMVAESMTLVVTQRLVRYLCPHCKKKGTPADSLLKNAEKLARNGGLGWEGLPRDFHQPVGCDRCRGIGYRGRNIIGEVMEVTPAIGAALRRGASVDDLRAIAVGEGMTTMAAHGMLKAAQGETTLDEVFRVLGVEI